MQNTPTAANIGDGAPKRTLVIGVGRRVKARAHLMLGGDVADMHYNEAATSMWEYGEIFRSAGYLLWTVLRDFDKSEVNMTRNNLKTVPDDAGVLVSDEDE